MDEFQVATALVINNPHLKLTATIHPQFTKESGDKMYVSMDFYQSRGLHAVLTSRLPVDTSSVRPYTTILTHVMHCLRRARDETFRKTVVSDVGDDGVHYRRKDSIMAPKNKRLKLAATVATDEITVKLSSASGAESSLTFLMPSSRKNRNNELWVEATNDAFDMMARLVAEAYARDFAEREGIGGSSTPTTTPSTCISGSSLSESRSPIAEHDEEQRGHPTTELAARTLRQTSLLAFLSKR